MWTNTLRFINHKLVFCLTLVWNYKAKRTKQSIHNLTLNHPEPYSIPIEWAVSLEYSFYMYMYTLHPLEHMTPWNMTHLSSFISIAPGTKNNLKFGSRQLYYICSTFEILNIPHRMQIDIRKCWELIFLEVK